MLEAAMAGLVGSVSLWQIVPRRAGPQDPQYAVKDTPGFAPAAPAAVCTLSLLLFPLQKRPDVFPLRIREISHAFHLLQLHSRSKHLFRSHISEIVLIADG